MNPWQRWLAESAMSPLKVTRAWVLSSGPAWDHEGMAPNHPTAVALEGATAKGRAVLFTVPMVNSEVLLRYLGDGERWGTPFVRDLGPPVNFEWTGGPGWAPWASVLTPTLFDLEHWLEITLHGTGYLTRDALLDMANDLADAARVAWGVVKAN